MSELYSKILKQVEYYFGDINLSKDTFLKTTLLEKDGWLPYETLLKFKRLNNLSTDIEEIKKAVSESTLVETGPEGIRRLPTNPAPANLTDALTIHADKALYVKGFPTYSTLDDLIAWIEKTGGPTYDVYCRRLPNKKFKGSIFVTFKSSEDAANFLKSDDAAQYQEHSLLRKWYKEYLEDKKTERHSRAADKAKKSAAAENRKETEITSRMTAGAVLELNGLPKVEKHVPTPEASGDVPENKDEENKDEENKDEEKKEDEKKDAEIKEDDKKIENNGTEKKSETVEEKEASSKKSRDDNMNTVSNLKDWLNEKLESNIKIAWIDVEPAANKAIVRFKEANTAEKALEKLTQSFDDGKIMYINSQLTGRVLSGEDEISFWSNLLAVFQAKKRKSGQQGGRGGGRFGNKRRRFN